MGLAAYGRFDPEIARRLEPLLWVEGLTLKQNLRAILDTLPWLQARGAPGDDPLKAADLACTGQRFFRDRLLELIANLHHACPQADLVLGGGCALNSAANGEVVANGPFRRLYVPSAPADDGTALGAAWLAWRRDHPQRPLPSGPLSPYLGSAIDRGRLEALLRHSGLAARRHPDDLAATVAAELAAGRIVAWMQGRAEFGPRALGNRSILADPRDADMPRRLNAEVKFREAFRPFAPAVLDECGPDWFEDYQFSPYMERALRFRPECRDRVPAVVHTDGTGRLQSVRRDLNPRFHALIGAFRDRTGVPLLLNTSLNRMGKPMVHSVEDALALFLTSGIDLLVIDDWLVRKPT